MQQSRGSIGHRRVFLSIIALQSCASKVHERRRQTFDYLIVILLLSLALIPWETWYGGRVRLKDALKGMSLEHPLGTDSLGRDLLVRISDAIVSGILPLWFSVVVGVLFGGGLAFLVFVAQEKCSLRTFLRPIDGLAIGLGAIPAGVMAFAWGAFEQKAGLVAVMWTLGILFASRMYLLLRDLERRDRELGYWAANRALGGSVLMRNWRYGICAGWSWAIGETLSLNLRIAVAIEAAISYLGFGIAEPKPSFGNMLAAHFDYYLKGHGSVIVPMIFGLGLTAAFPGALLRCIMRASTYWRTFSAPVANALPAHSQAVRMESAA